MNTGATVIKMSIIYYISDNCYQKYIYDKRYKPYYTWFVGKCEITEQL